MRASTFSKPTVHVIRIETSTIESKHYIYVCEGCYKVGLSVRKRRYHNRACINKGYYRNKQAKLLDVL